MLVSTLLDNQPLIEKAKKLNPLGTVFQSNTYAFLNIDDTYIHALFDLLDPAYNAQKPDYFSAEKSIGAHITVVYNEENVLLHQHEIGKIHAFSVTGLYSVTLGNKVYFVLMIASPSLRALRTTHGLPEQPCYKGYPIDFHITIAVKSL